MSILDKGDMHTAHGHNCFHRTREANNTGFQFLKSHSRSCNPLGCSPTPPLELFDNMAHFPRGKSEDHVLYFSLTKGKSRDFPGGPVVKNLPANAEDERSIPGPGRPHMCCRGTKLLSAPQGRAEPPTSEWGACRSSQQPARRMETKAGWGGGTTAQIGADVLPASLEGGIEQDKQSLFFLIALSLLSRNKHTLRYPLSIFPKPLSMILSPLRDFLGFFFFCQCVCALMCACTYVFP